MRLLIFALFLLSSSNLIAQRIIRSSISSIGSSFTGKLYLLSSSPTSLSIVKSQNNVDGTTNQTRPFIHLKNTTTSKSIDINIQPNPSQDLVYLKTKEIIKNIEVIDVSGRICHQGNLTILSLGHLESGVYTIKVTLENDITHSQKFILNK